MAVPTSVDATVAVAADVPAGADAVVVLAAKGEPAAGPYGPVVAGLVKAGLVTGKAGEAVVHWAESAGQRVVVVGLGDRAKADAEAYRRAGGAVARVARKHRLRAVAVLDPADPAAVATGFLLARFDFREYKGSAQPKDDAEHGTAAAIALTLVTARDAAAEVGRAAVIAAGQNFARTIATRPSNDINPPTLAEAARAMAAEVGLAVRVLDETEMKQLGMGGITAVGAGSATPPRMIVLEHQPDPRSPASNPLLVIGKSITFDTGGVSIKPAAGMQAMVFDKCGGMAVLGLMYAAAKLRLPVPIVGILAAAENHLGGTAYRPGDILRMVNGVTVEVTNTDAEGRLVLGDALAWGIAQYKPAAVVDLATLTGSCVVALGKTMAGLMSNSDALVAELQAACARTGERAWRLPVDDEHRERLKSGPADIVNSAGRDGGTLLAAAFLSHFVPTDGSVPWAHLDIAGVADTDKELPYYAKGATGWGVRTLVEWASGRAGGVPAGSSGDQPTPPPAGG